STLKKAPKILKSVRVNLTIDVSLRMVNRLVREVSVKPDVRHKGIGVDGTLGCNVSANLRLQVPLATARNDHRNYLAATLQHPTHSGLGLHSAFRDDALATARVHESRSTTDERFVHFHFATRTAHPNKVLVVHGEPDAVHHVPCGLLSDAEGASNFV